MKTNQLNQTMEFENIAEYKKLTLKDLESALLKLFANTDSGYYSEWDELAKKMQEDIRKRYSTRRCKKID